MKAWLTQYWPAVGAIGAVVWRIGENAAGHLENQSDQIWWSVTLLIWVLLYIFKTPGKE